MLRLWKWRMEPALFSNLTLQHHIYPPKLAGIIRENAPCIPLLLAQVVLGAFGSTHWILSPVLGCGIPSIYLQVRASWRRACASSIIAQLWEGYLGRPCPITQKAGCMSRFGYLQLRRLQCRRRRPLVAGSVREFVAVRGREVVQDGRTPGAWRFVSVLGLFIKCARKIHRRDTPWE